MTLRLYKLDPSPPARAVLMTIEALNLKDVEYVDVNLLEGEHLKDEFLQLNPQHTIPTLKDGDFVIWDSHAISTYLVGKYGETDALYPTDLKKRAIVDQRLHFDSGILFPAGRGVLLNPQHTIPTLKDGDFVIWDSHAISTYLVGKYGETDALYPTDLKKRAIVDQRLHFDSGILFPAGRGVLEPILFWGESAYRPEGLEKIKAAYGFAEKFLSEAWLAGDEITLADICCVATISTLNFILPIDGNEFPKLQDWYARCSEQEFYKKKNEKGLLQLRDIVTSKLA